MLAGTGSGAPITSAAWSLPRTVHKLPKLGSCLDPTIQSLHTTISAVGTLLYWSCNRYKYPGHSLAQLLTDYTAATHIQGHDWHNSFASHTAAIHILDIRWLGGILL
jgi:hypothetical protein